MLLVFIFDVKHLLHLLLQLPSEVQKEVQN